jgi:hypothetical protein
MPKNLTIFFVVTILFGIVVTAGLAFTDSAPTVAVDTPLATQDPRVLGPGRHIRTSDLGWHEGMDVSDPFAKLLKDTLQAGDTLVLDHFYRISAANLRLPEKFTLAAEVRGGLDVTTTGDDASSLFIARNGTVFDGVTFRISAPETSYAGTNPKRGIDYNPKKILLLYGADISIVNSAFSGNALMFVDAHNGDRLTISDTSFEGGFYQVRMVGSVDDATIVGSHFKHSLGDGIKTERDGEHGPQRARILNSYFEGANRDGIDTAGGFRGGYIADTIFHDNSVSALDLKTILEKPEDLSIYNDNSDILIERVEITDSRNAIVVTMLDRIKALTAENADIHMPHDIVVRDSIIEKTPAHDSQVRAFLVKDGYNINWSNIRLLGDVYSELRIMNAEAPPGWTAYNVQGNVSYGEGRTDEERAHQVARFR